jgi:hypothetical protein
MPQAVTICSDKGSSLFCKVVTKKKVYSTSNQNELSEAIFMQFYIRLKTRKSTIILD